MTTNVVSAQEVSRHAAVLNGGMGSLQLFAGAFTGNFGFVGESAHNFGDAVSFEAKSRAISSEAEDSDKSSKLRLLAAGVFGAGAVGSVLGGSYELITDRMEHASTATICVAGISAAINTVIARRTHKAVESESNGSVMSCAHDCHGHSHDKSKDDINFGAVLDSRLHAMTDSGTGWLYTAGLMAQAKGWGDHWGATAVLVNGLISSMAAGFMFRRLSKDRQHI